MRGENLFEPRDFRCLILGRKYLYDITLLKFFVQITHFAIDFHTNNVIADSSIGIKAVAAAGFGLTALNLATGAVKSLLRMVGLAPAKSTRKERRQAAKEIKLSKKTIKEIGSG